MANPKKFGLFSNDLPMRHSGDLPYIGQNGQDLKDPKALLNYFIALTSTKGELQIKGFENYKIQFDIETASVSVTHKQPGKFHEFYNLNHLISPIEDVIKSLNWQTPKKTSNMPS